MGGLVPGDKHRTAWGSLLRISQGFITKQPLAREYQLELNLCRIPRLDLQSHSKWYLLEAILRNSLNQTSHPRNRHRVDRERGSGRIHRQISPSYGFSYPSRSSHGIPDTSYCDRSVCLEDHYIGLSGSLTNSMGRWIIYMVGMVEKE